MSATNLLLVGCGNMGGAMLAGWLSQGHDPHTITVIDPKKPDADGVQWFAELPADLPPPDVAVLAVKPQMLAAIAPRLNPLISVETVVLSVLAAVEFATLRQRLPRAGTIVRAVPNLPASIGQGITALAGDRLTQAARNVATTLCEPLGLVAWMESEAHLDAATPVSGCGPAFLFRFTDAVCRAAQAQGLPEDQARRLMGQTMIGAGAMLLQSTESPGQMASRVASPGGVTLAGLGVLDQDDALVKLMAATLEAAARHNAEMAQATR
ncbi:pyrroline-5-carboxylate reductase [Asticcacaulis sp.]|uniref:pyrroline-5-carboxylate reductase n=1 Tax=Asticcacaulis sp. TaxID=1872648 RepID=UPI002C9A6383|nr:pyrroline-5-carboxylate reductase [Asticcacaulis sp.]HTM81362.1 pyrroline-5-carboxylate reductase [Asticcacaulis sp.]